MGGKISLIGVPLMAGANRSGIERGPAALLQAGVPGLLRGLGYSVTEAGEIPVPLNDGKGRIFPALKNLDLIKQVSEALCETVSAAVGEGYLPLVLGGDHSIAIGTIAGVCRHYRPLGVIWIDAHGDMNTHRTTPSGNIHGMSLAASMGAGYPAFTTIGGKPRKIEPKHTVLIGVRSLDPGECLMIRKFGIRLYTMEDVRILGMARIMKEAMEIAGSGTRGIHLSFDLDAMDPALAPGVSTPVPDGLSMEQASAALAEIYRSGKLLSAEFVELNPSLDPQGRTAKLAAELIGELFGGQP